MKLFVNGKEQSMVSPISLISLAQSLQLPEQGIAMAVNNRMIPRTEWNEFILKENDNVIIIKAACGG